MLAMNTLKKRGQQIAAALLVATGVVGTAYAMQRPSPTVESLALTIPTVVPTPTATAMPTPAPIVVFVSGEVLSPGVYTLPPESRVVDAIEAAGGLTTDADASAVNQAIILEDGMQIHVPEIGEVATPLPLSGDDSSGAESSGKININTATPEELDTLPGIGPALAEAIIRHRETNGVFESVEQLVDVPGIGDATLAEIRELVTVE
jgi:competence protein ComEA